ncbi:hypothetical protein V6N11_002236 [Hibiscus sabdariffa]|uniref:Uncharacterized protein n=1 Tax=Hibiscus sabdariffa TaxID=183260 RepID=A0ABR2QUU2_9ROSI
MFQSRKRSLAKSERESNPAVSTNQSSIEEAKLEMTASGKPPKHSASVASGQSNPGIDPTGLHEGLSRKTRSGP